MSDRELLERAAKAAGIENLAPQGNVIICNDEDGYSAVWNPLTDDGDAFRLAVKLNMFVDVQPGASGAQIVGVAFVSQGHGSDRLAATRRTIVRAAAALADDAGAVPDKSDLPEDNYYKDQAEAFYGVEKK